MNYVLILNKTKGTTLGYAKIADSFFSRFRGLMLKRELKYGLVLKLPDERSKYGSSIHMFFVRFPLDILFADSKKNVVDLVSIKPWKTYTPKNPARYIIEMEEGTIKKSNTQIGDHLSFVCDRS